MLLVCCTHGYDGFCETVIYIIQQPLDLSQETVRSDAATELTGSMKSGSQ